MPEARESRTGGEAILNASQSILVELKNGRVDESAAVGMAQASLSLAQAGMSICGERYVNWGVMLLDSGELCSNVSKSSPITPPVPHPHAPPQVLDDTDGGAYAKLWGDTSDTELEEFWAWQGLGRLGTAPNTDLPGDEEEEEGADDWGFSAARPAAKRTALGVKAPREDEHDGWRWLHPTWYEETKAVRAFGFHILFPSRFMSFMCIR